MRLLCYQYRTYRMLIKHKEPYQIVHPIHDFKAFYTVPPVFWTGWEPGNPSRKRRFMQFSYVSGPGGNPGTHRGKGDSCSFPTFLDRVGTREPIAEKAIHAVFLRFWTGWEPRKPSRKRRFMQFSYVSHP